MVKFEKFIQENDAKTKRADKKVQVRQIYGSKVYWAQGRKKSLYPSNEFHR